MAWKYLSRGRLLCYVMLCYGQIPNLLNILNDAEKEISAEGEVQIFSQEN